MNANPYAAPKTETPRRPPGSDARVAARRSVRIALLIMLVPAAYNFICFSFLNNANRIELSIHSIYRTINLFGFVATTIAIWFLGLAALELLTAGIHAVFARHSKLHDWNAILYVVLRRAPLFAMFGAVLWVIWVAAFYQLKAGFYAVSVPIGVAAHLLAAGLYVPLLYRWYKTERSSETQTTA